MNAVTTCLESLAGTPTVLAGMVGEIAPERLTLRRGEGTWTILEHVRHLAEVEQMLLGRVALMQGQERPVITPFDPFAGGEARSELGPQEALEAFAARRRRLLDLFVATPATLWDREAAHPEYERYSLRILVRHVLAHDYWHLYRMEEVWLLRDGLFQP